MFYYNNQKNRAIAIKNNLKLMIGTGYFYHTIINQSIRVELQLITPPPDQCCGSWSGRIRTFFSDMDPVKFFGSGSEF